ncbi:MAG: response regulator [Deltaproteobacteria bacterium]|nr:response regulator [Deltaproteobacteria bacterium]
MDKPIHVLIVEDSENDALLIVREFRRSGYDVTYERVDTSEAMEAAINQQKWDVILSDHSMPHFSSFGALELVKKTGLDLPFIIVSGSIGEETAVAAMKAGVHDYIMKDNLPRLVPAIGRELREAEIRSERKRAEESLKDQKEILQRVIDNIPVMITMYDAKGEMKLFNKEFVRLVGWTDEEARHLDLMEKFYPDPGYRKMAWEYMMSATMDWREFEVTTREGGILESIWSNVRLPDGTQIGIGIDVTERKRAEEEREKMQAQLIQAQKMESIGTLAGGVAHDFNNLLTTIQGYAQLGLMSMKEEEPLYENLKEILQASQRAASLTRQLLLFSRKQPMEPFALNLSDTVNNLMKMLKRLIGENIAVETHLEPNLWIVKADPGNMEQVIMNLVVNARDAMPEGGKITIKTENVDIDKGYCDIYNYARPGQFICLSVEDTGIGMDKEIIQHIFEPFFTTKGVGKGTGLGLSVVYGIVKQHEGWINVYSEPGQGSIFKVYLPVSSEETKYETKREVISIQDFQGKGERILLVEDDSGIREFVNKVLTKSGYEVLEASNTQEALDISEKESGGLALVFSDVVLPDKSGLQLAEELLLRKPTLKVLLTSGYTDQKSQWSVIKEKGYCFIQKPYNLNDLLRVVREVLDK